jgi:TatD DNase family protein
MVDTHCHLEQSEFAEDLSDVISRARECGIHMITSAISQDDWDRAIEIGKEYDNVDVSLGVDPLSYNHAELLPDGIREWSEEIIAVGEAGLDHYRERDHTLRDIQEKMFRNMISFAMEIDVPIQVHSRSAGKKALQVLVDTGIQNVHMHAFDGKASLARSASRDLGYYFSIPTSVVRSPQKKKLAKAVDIERLLLETDSPVLGPEKGVRNEPVNLPIVVTELAEILHRSTDEIQEITLENTLRLYRRIVL